MATFVLIHSPLVGPITWSLVAEELRKRSASALVPSLHASLCAGGPYWQRHVAAVASAIRDVPPDELVMLAAHSGAGPLLPAIGKGAGRPVAGYVFADAALPGRDGQSRLDLFAPADADRFRQSAIEGSISAIWRNDATLRAAGVEDTGLRRRFAADVPDVPLAVYEEPLPVPQRWPDAPCAYLLFSAPYDAEARHVRVRGWAFRKLPGGHLLMLVDPPAVAGALLELAAEMEI